MRMMRWLHAVVLLVGCSKQSPIAKDTVYVNGATVLAAPAAATAPPESPTRGFQKSYDEEALGHLDVALAALNDVPTTTNASYVAELRRGWLLYRIGKNAESVDAYRKATALAPASIEARVGALAPLAALRRWADIEVAARDTLRKDPGNYQATIRLAFALYSLARFGDATATYRGLLAAYPSDPDVGAGLGWSLLKLGKKEDAAAAFGHVLEIAPRNALAVEGARAAQ